MKKKNGTKIKRIASKNFKSEIACERCSKRTAVTIPLSYEEIEALDRMAKDLNFSRQELMENILIHRVMNANLYGRWHLNINFSQELYTDVEAYAKRCNVDPEDVVKFAVGSYLPKSK